ncbi:hypothetical protein U91I_01485 [alpha proteobacterium U9-1i]|nr:hypothetical protein U91I_01485 [alpha proteobacterium U9-1i]
MIKNRDYGAALHLCFHLAELNYELTLRLSGISDLVDIGLAVSEKRAFDDELDPAARKREQFWEAYELQYVGERKEQPLRPTPFAREHWRRFGFPSSGSAQKFLSRRLSGLR